ncbi:hypothetical protein NRK67_16635 (plasmid) [Fusobacteria bacterium ZRK30]|nr:hypothetical protein NRK67_16635 [Fusobacteria bacterium ZRK30]
MATKKSLTEGYINDIKNAYTKSKEVDKVINKINGLSYNNSGENLNSYEKIRMFTDVLDGLNSEDNFNKKPILENSNEHYLKLLTATIEELENETE